MTTTAQAILHADADDVASADRELPMTAKTGRHRGVSMSDPIRAFQRAVSGRLIMAPVASVKTVGRGVMMAMAVIRYVIQDAVSLRLAVREIVYQAWSLYKVTALPALLMAVPFGGMVAVQTSGLINQVGAASIVGAASGVGVVRQGRH
jgi:phospholipid/cholesterol/gamma-HCH transport system permease protein